MTTVAPATPPGHGGASGELRRTLAVDGLIAFAAAAVASSPLFMVFLPDIPGLEAPMFWPLVIVLIVNAPVAFRRVAPTAAFVVSLGGPLLPMIPWIEDVAGVLTQGINNDLAIMICLFTLASSARWRVTALATAAAVGVLAIRSADLLGPTLADERWWWSLVVSTVPRLVIPFVLVVGAARLLRTQRVRTEVAQRAAVDAFVAAEVRAATAAATERRRLAAELHDIVANHVNLIVIHSEQGPFLATRDAAMEKFAGIGSTGRAALSELDRLLGLLRSDEFVTGGPTVALPTVAEIPGLIDAAARAGCTVSLDAFDPPAQLEPQLAATVHRVVQECVTNVVKHADPAARASVSITHGDGRMVVKVRNRIGRRLRSGRAGFGLESMRTRVETVGGALSIDDTDGEFEVTATIPLRAAA